MFDKTQQLEVAFNVIPRSRSYGVYIFQLSLFARESGHVADFNTRNKLLTQKLLKQGYRYHKLRRNFSKFYRLYYDLISKFQIGLDDALISKGYFMQTKFLCVLIHI